MREPALSQKARFILLIIEAGVICLASWVAFGRIFPPDGEKGFWFYTALLGLILGSRLDTPFYARPADVVLYAAPAAIALALVNSWSSWDSGIKVAFVVAVLFCVLVCILGAVGFCLRILGSLGCNEFPTLYVCCRKLLARLASSTLW